MLIEYKKASVSTKFTNLGENLELKICKSALLTCLDGSGD